jgi:hypothetical protein
MLALEKIFFKLKVLKIVEGYQLICLLTYFFIVVCKIRKP